MLMRKVVVGSLCALGMLVGCESQPAGAPGASGSNVSTRGVAGVRHAATQSTTVVFLNENNASHIPDILAGASPTGFEWISIQVGPTHAGELDTAAGANLDLTDLAADVVFTQSYSGPCNPALNNFDACWLKEQYRAGDEGLTGSIRLQLSQGIATGNFDVSWSGMTDRFGVPTQHHTHETSMEVSAVIETGAGQ